LCSLQAPPHTVHVPMHLAIPRPHDSMDHRYNSLPFSIQNSNSYSLMSQSFMLQGSHTGLPLMMPWGGSPTTGQPPTWPLLPRGGYWPPPPLSGYWPPPPLASHPDQSCRASPTVGNAFMDDTDTTAATTFFFTTDGKSFVPTFNCSIHNTSKCRTSRLLIHFCL
jgi:hypothetical protein